MLKNQKVFIDFASWMLRCNMNFWMKNQSKNEVEYRHRFLIDFWLIFRQFLDPKSLQNRSRNAIKTDQAKKDSDLRGSEGWKELSRGPQDGWWQKGCVWKNSSPASRGHGEPPPKSGVNPSPSESRQLGLTRVLSLPCENTRKKPSFEHGARSQGKIPAVPP